MFLGRPGLLGVTGPPRTGVAVVRQGRGVGLGQGPGPRRRSEPVKAAPSGLHRLSPGGRLHYPPAPLGERSGAEGPKRDVAVNEVYRCVGAAAPARCLSGW